MVDWAADLYHDTNQTGRVYTHINFHLCPPTAEFASRACHWHDIEGAHSNLPALVDAILSNGTAKNKIRLAQLDAMAEHLRRLQARGVPVIWHPFHEANGGWFWWGQQPGSNR
jgi:mannan endo-1,4-beta-mannosidase